MFTRKERREITELLRMYQSAKAEKKRAEYKMQCARMRLVEFIKRAGDSMSHYSVNLKVNHIKSANVRYKELAEAYPYIARKFSTPYEYDQISITRK